jgi:hypothetical protein
MLTGRLPFAEAESPLAMLYQRVHVPPVPIMDAAPSLPAPLGAVVMSAISTDPLDRPPSADWFAVELAGRATDAFGRGWFERTGFRASLGGRIAAITERSGGAVAPTTPSGRMRPERPTNVVRGTPDVQPSALVPVADAPGHDDTLRELRLLLSRSENGDAQRLAREIERTQATAHDLHEMELLRRVRSADTRLRDPDRAEIEQLLGANGTSPAARVGLGADAPATAVRTAAIEIAERWKRRAENPLTARSIVSIASEVVHTCERILTELPPAG